MIIIIMFDSSDIAGQNYNVLVFSKTVEKRHDSIPNGIKAIKELGLDNNFNVSATEDSEYFTINNLKDYDVIIFLSTSGDILDEKQQGAFENYIQNGGGFVGIHSASATEYDWSWYGKLIGAYFDKHPKIQKATINVSHRCHPSTICLPAEWEWVDEWYNFKNDLDKNINVLATVDESTYEGGKHSNYHPVMWCHEFDGGRSWYTALGHKSESYQDSLFRENLLGAIKYAAGLNNIPNIFLTDSKILNYNKKKLYNGDPDLLSSLENLLLIVDTMLNIKPISVMDKIAVPPSDDKHDYMSIAPYWWPDPNKEDGLPYIRKDGKSNPERGKYDSDRIKLLQYNAPLLALAYYYTEYEMYAEHSAELIKTWFLNPETKMNPNLKYAQSIPGKTEGRGIGIIDTRRFGDIGGAIGLIESSKFWDEEDTQDMKNWFREYLDWLLTSDNGKAEAAWYNNHGTWYDVQTVHMALFINDLERVKDIINKVPNKRIDTQIEPDGSQPYELKRTRSFNYSTMNLTAFFRLAKYGEYVNINLWEYESEDGRSLRKALEYLVPFAVGEKEWTFEMLRGWEDAKDKMFLLLRVASTKYESNNYELLIDKLDGINKNVSPINLIYPAN